MDISSINGVDCLNSLQGKLQKSLFLVIFGRNDPETSAYDAFSGLFH